MQFHGLAKDGDKSTQSEIMGNVRSSFGGSDRDGEASGNKGRRHTDLGIVNEAWYLNEHGVITISSPKHSNVNIELDSIAESGNEDSSSSKRGASITAAGDAVLVRNAKKSYRSGEPILNGLNMTVPCGSIYGLLGSSGCGKTTMLSCIVGIRQLDKGKIWIFGKKPGSKSVGVPGRNVGYMPQDLSLYNEFTIAETLNYFGALSGMTKEEIQSSREFLVNLLDLPEEARRVGTLSGGQQRRVSLVVALLNDPELLILDEPTVGLDPLLRQNIWIHLKKLVSSKRITIIITTHYIEECRNADNIGVMRNGKLLVERPPQELMVEYGSYNLEKIVLDLARRDTEAQQSREGENETTKEKAKADKEVPANMATVLHEQNDGLKETFGRIRALTGKNFVVLLRTPLLLFFVILIAALLVLLMCIALGPDPKELSVGLVNNEVHHYSSCLNTTRIPGECHVESLSCLYLSNLKKGSLDLHIFDSESDAAAEVHAGSSWGYIVFPSGFSVSFFERLVSGNDPDEQTFNGSEFLVKLDASNKQISNTIKTTLYDAYEDFVANMLADCGYDPRQGESILKYRKPIFGDDTTDFREFLAPGAALVLLFFFPIITTSVRYIKEKKNGVLHRSIVGGVRTWEIMVAYSISEFCVLLFQAFLNYAVISIIFKITIQGSDVLVIILFLLSGYGGVSMGFLLGTICREEIEAAILAMAAFFPNMILSGMIWPLEGMVVPLQYVVQVLPCTHAAESVRSITSRGWEFSHPSVWPGFVMLIGYIFGYFILTMLFHVIFRK